jgi:hypothetical protein
MKEMNIGEMALFYNSNKALRLKYLFFLKKNIVHRKDLFFNAITIKKKQILIL